MSFSKQVYLEGRRKLVEVFSVDMLLEFVGGRVGVGTHGTGQGQLAGGRGGGGSAAGSAAKINLLIE